MISGGLVTRTVMSIRFAEKKGGGSRYTGEFARKTLLYIYIFVIATAVELMGLNVIAVKARVRRQGTG